jgi:hypothetical protein
LILKAALPFASGAAPVVRKKAMDSAPGFSRPLAPSRMLVLDFRDAISHPPLGELYMARLVKFVKLVKP